MPSLFLAHGSPMIAIQDNEYTRTLRTLGKSLRPAAVVVFTAHWESETLTISSMDGTYETIYDFGGFPPELSQVVYPAGGSVSIASKLKQKFEETGIPVRTDPSRGLDHGVWTLLVHLFPEADIPVIPISVNPYLPVSEQYKIGQVLRGLSAENILVIGSGATVHNLRRLRWGQETPEPWAVEFDDWLLEKLRARDIDSLDQYGSLAPNSALAVPTPEHFVPVILALGSGGGPAKPRLHHRSYEYGTLSYLIIEF